MIWHTLYIESKKEKIQMNVQNRKSLTDLENEFMVAGGKDVGKV